MGTAFLVAAVVGSGIMAERLAGGNVALALLANTLATGAALVALILTFITVSGAHFNPAVTLSVAWEGKLPWREVPAYITAQIAGALTGAAVAHLMFGFSLFSPSQHVRAGSSQLLGEFIATFWPGNRYLGLCAFTPYRYTLRCGGLYYDGLLVYFLNLVCQSCCNNRTVSKRYLYRHPSD